MLIDFKGKRYSNYYDAFNDFDYPIKKKEHSDMEYVITKISNNINDPYLALTFKDGECTLDLDVPGVKKEDIEIVLEDGYLSIKTTRKNIPTFRRYTTPAVNPQLATAKLEDGVLTVKLYTITQKFNVKIT